MNDDSINEGIEHEELPTKDTPGNNDRVSSHEIQSDFSASMEGI